MIHLTAMQELQICSESDEINALCIFVMTGKYVMDDLDLVMLQTNWILTKTNAKSDTLKIKFCSQRDMTDLMPF